MKKTQKKGFTIVELLVVIAVIAVLAAVMIPVMITLIDDAKVSNDEQIVSSLNRAIAAETGDIDTMSDAVDAAADYGYDVEKLTLESDSDVLVWDQDSKYFGIVTTSGEEVYSNGGLTDEDGHLWVITDGSSDTAGADGLVTLSGRTIVASAASELVYSSYLAEGYEGDTEFTAGVDVGRNEDIDVTVSSSCEGLIVNVSGGCLTVSGGAGISQYGTADSVSVSGGSSLTVYGTVDGELTLEAGSVTAASGSTIGAIVITASDASSVSVTAASGASVETVTATDSSVLAAVSITGVSDSAVVALDETQQKAYNEGWFGGGIGTSGSPFLIGSAENFGYISTASSSGSYYYSQTADITLTTSQKSVSLAGVYDGAGNSIQTAWKYSGDSNYSYIFYGIAGYASVTDLRVTMGSYGTTLFYFVDWGTAYGLDVTDVSFSSTSSTVSLSCSNWGFICINAIYTSASDGSVTADDPVVYNFTGVTNSVNVVNGGTCTSPFVGSGPCFNVATVVNYKNCVNNATVSGTSSVGFLYGNSAYIGSVTGTDATEGCALTVEGCQNNGVLMSVSSSATVALAPGYEELNTEYQDSVGGVYVSSNCLASGAPAVYQNGTAFIVTDETYTYQLVLNIGARYFTLDGEDWEDSDTEAVESGEWATVSNVSNNVKLYVELSVDTGVTSGDLGSFYAYDYNTALSKGIVSESDSLDFDEDELYAIVTVDGVNYVILNYADSYYVCCSVSVYVYAYNSAGTLSGVALVA